MTVSEYRWCTCNQHDCVKTCPIHRTKNNLQDPHPLNRDTGKFNVPNYSRVENSKHPLWALCAKEDKTDNEKRLIGAVICLSTKEGFSHLTPEGIWDAIDYSYVDKPTTSKPHLATSGAEPSRGAPDAAHTPGPWKAGYWSGICRIPEHKGHHPGGDQCKYEPVFYAMEEDEYGIVSFPGIASEQPGVDVVWTEYDELKIRPADARLIAQAPTLLAENEKLRAGHVVLLEACKGLLEELRLIRMKDTNAVYDPTIRTRAEAAIKQAERA